LSSLVNFLTLFLKLHGLQETVPKASAGSWFQSSINKKYAKISDTHANEDVSVEYIETKYPAASLQSIIIHN
jgi:hypothetical protein